MSLFDDLYVDCVVMVQAVVPDGEGGTITTWEDGDHFDAAITFDSSMQARAAEKQGVTSLYTITTSRGATLNFHDVIKRVSDGKIYRITSDGGDKVTPASASFSFSQVTAEEWTLP